MRPGVVWFGEQLPWNEMQRVENLSRSAELAIVVIVAGTTATFGYIIDWALRASRRFRRRAHRSESGGNAALTIRNPTSARAGCDCIAANC
mgnify:CR=1 FL=1